MSTPTSRRAGERPLGRLRQGLRGVPPAPAAATGGKPGGRRVGLRHHRPASGRELLKHAGLDVRVVTEGSALSASQFNPRLSLVERPGELMTLSGSPSLSGAGWTSNVEQFEELVHPTRHRRRTPSATVFEAVWDHGSPLQLLRRSGDWDLYRQRARGRRRLERADRRRLLRLQARTGLRPTRGSVAPGATRPTRATTRLPTPAMPSDATATCSGCHR